MREYYEHIKAKASLSMQDVIETCRSLTPSDYKTRPYRFPDLRYVFRISKQPKITRNIQA